MYKVGDKVRIRKDIEAYDEKYAPVGVVPEMLKHRGKATAIKRKLCCHRYELDIDRSFYTGTNEMLEPVEAKEQPFKPGDNVRVIEGGVGARGANGKTGVIVSPDTPISNGCRGESGVKVRIGEEIWELAPQYKLEKVEECPRRWPQPDCGHDGAIGLHHLTLPTGYIQVEYGNKPKRRGGGYMSQLSKLAKKLLDPDTKALVKAGILDKDLDVTEEGADFIFAFIVDKNKAELAKEARTLLREQKKEESEE